MSIFTDAEAQVVSSRLNDLAKGPDHPDSLAAKDREIARLREALKEARLQIEYLDAKFQPTGTSANVLARIERALAQDGRE